MRGKASSAMKIAVLETGVPPAPLGDEFGSYPDMFADLLGPNFELETFDVQTGSLPAPAAHGAYLVTGSPAGVYEPLPWIAPLMEFIRAASDAKSRTVAATPSPVPNRPIVISNIAAMGRMAPHRNSRRILFT